jgi:hypothetical protein
MDDTLLQKQTEVLSQIADNMAKLTEKLDAKETSKETTEEETTKTPAGVHTAIRLHGSSGIFTGGLEREVITAHVRPYGLASQLPALPSVSEDPRFASITGFTATVGAEPANACDDAPYGFMKGCNLTARFGMLRRDTNTIEMDKVMLKLHRGDFTDLVLKGRLLGLTDLIPSGLNESQVLDIITMAEMVIVGVNTERAIGHYTWQGTRTVGTEWAGLDVQIATGQIDADTSVACPALDSDIKNFNYHALDSSIVEIVGSMEWYLNNNATTMGLDPVEWVICMNPNLWFELSSVWPCAYNTNRCVNGLASSSQLVLDGRENTRDRDAMRQGMYLDINGRRYKVVLDTNIFEHNNINNANLKAGEYAGSLYMIPLTIVGNFPVTYREYVDYRQASSNINLLNGKEEFFWTDNGMYSWAIEQIKWCYKMSLKTEQRIILRTPQLAGRVDAIKYTPTQHLRDSDPASPYFKDGGVSIRGKLGEPLAVWASR